jgi:DNA-binding MarR family transcriptional regulator
MATPPHASTPSLLEELQQSRPFRSAGQEAVLGVARTASLLNRYTAALLEPEGISTAQYNVLRILRGAGEEGLPTLSIRDRMIDPAAAITRLLDKLVSAGLALRDRGDGDRRQIVCRISQAGLDLLARLDPTLIESEESIAGSFSGEELETLNGLLARIRERVR